MFGFLEFGRAIQALYQYSKEEIVDSDFFELEPALYKKLPPSEQQKKWYTLNPNKLNENYVVEKAFLIVDEHEKATLLRAVGFVNKTAANLPPTATFLEKLLYTKGFIPSCLFSNTKKEVDGTKVIPLNKEKC